MKYRFIFEGNGTLPYCVCEGYTPRVWLTLLHFIEISAPNNPLPASLRHFCAPFCRPNFVPCTLVNGLGAI